MAQTDKNRQKSKISIWICGKFKKDKLKIDAATKLPWTWLQPVIFIAISNTFLTLFGPSMALKLTEISIKSRDLPI